MKKKVKKSWNFSFDNNNKKYDERRWTKKWIKNSSFVFRNKTFIFIYLFYIFYLHVSILFMVTFFLKKLFCASNEFFNILFIFMFYYFIFNSCLKSFECIVLLQQLYIKTLVILGVPDQLNSIINNVKKSYILYLIGVLLTFILICKMVLQIDRKFVFKMWYIYFYYIFGLPIGTCRSIGITFDAYPKFKILLLNRASTITLSVSKNCSFNFKKPVRGLGHHVY